MTNTLFSEAEQTNKFERIIADLSDTGLSICDDFISPLLVSNLSHEARTMHANGEFRHARVGKGESLQLREEVRNDHIHWLDPENPSPIQLPYFQELETLRMYINSNLFLGLFEYEGHYALYPPGASYKMHYDRFIGAHQRMVTAILYLNHDWQEQDGGFLKVYEGTKPSELNLPMEVLPLGGRLVTFISELFPHEVLPSTRDRLSLTGWFRIRE